MHVGRGRLSCVERDGDEEEPNEASSLRDPSSRIPSTSEDEWRLRWESRPSDKVAGFF